MYNDLNASSYALIQYHTHSQNIHGEYSLPVYRTMIRSGLGVGFSLKHNYEEQISTYITDLPSIAISDNIKIPLLCIYDQTVQHTSAVQYFIDYLKSCTQV